MGNPTLNVADIHLFASLLQVTLTFSWSFYCHTILQVWVLSFLRPLGGKMSGSLSEQGEEPPDAASVPVNESGC